MNENKPKIDLFLEIASTHLDKMIKLIPKKNNDLKETLSKNLSIMIYFTIIQIFK